MLRDNVLKGVKRQAILASAVQGVISVLSADFLEAPGSLISEVKFRDDTTKLL